jgi:erythrocyte band 7 integral membrane protein
MSHTYDSSIIAESTSSTKPILHDTNNTIDTEITSGNMSDINGKAPINGASNGASRLDEPIVKVQPPRREDLQPSYARVIQPDDADADTNGWYGAMVSVSISSRYASLTNV